MWAPRSAGGFQTAGLEDHALVAVIEDGHFGVGGVARFDEVGIAGLDVVAETSAVGDDRVGKAFDSEVPAGDVGLVRSLIPHVAVAVESLPVPVVMETRAGQRFDGRRATPDVVVDRFRNFVLAQRADRLAAFIAEAAGEFHFTETALHDELVRIDVRGIRAALRSDLAHSVVLLRGGDQRLAFMDVVGDRLFEIAVFAGLHRPDATKSMGMVGSGVADDVDRRVVERFTHIFDEFRLLAALFFGDLVAFRFAGRIGIANVQNFGLRVVHPLFAVGPPAATTDADHANAQLVVRADRGLRLAGFVHGVNARRRRAGGRCGKHGVFQKTTSCNLAH